MWVRLRQAMGLDAEAIRGEIDKWTLGDVIQTRPPRFFAPGPLEVVSNEVTQVECRLDKGPRGGTADASVLGAESGTIHLSRREANRSDKPAYFPIVASTSNDERRTEATASEHGVLPEMLPDDFSKATIDAAWDLLPDDVKATILAFVQDAMKRGDGE